MEYIYEAMVFGIPLRKIRKKRGYTQEQLAEKLFYQQTAFQIMKTDKPHVCQNM